MKHVLFLLFCIFCYCACQNNTPLEENPTTPLANAQQTIDKKKQYPLLLAVDPAKATTARDISVETLFSKVTGALKADFTVHNSFAKGVSGNHAQQALFAKYPDAYICLYITIKMRREGEGAYRTFYSPDVDCRVIDVTTGEELVEIKIKAEKEVFANRENEEENEIFVVQQIAKTVTEKLSALMLDLVQGMIRQTYRIKGKVAQKDVAIFREILNNLVAEKHIRLKQTIAEGREFEYEVVGRKLDITGFVRLLKNAITAKESSMLIASRGDTIELSS